MRKLINDYNCNNCPHSWNNFKNLTSQELALVSKNRIGVSFKAGEIILKEGAPATSAVFLVSGVGKISLAGIDSKCLILNLALPGQIIIGPGAYVDGLHQYSLVAITDIKACFIDINILKQFVHTNSLFAEGWLIDISQKALMAHKRMISLTQKKMPGRLADALLYFSNHIAKADEFEILLSRQELGEFSNMSKESVSRMLKEFEDEGVLESDCHKIKIIHKTRLEKISNFG